MATADITPELPTASTWKFERNAGNGAPIEASDDRFALSDVFVAIAITMISAALMIALLHQTSLPAMSCVLLAAAVWFSMILGHVSLRRSERGRTMDAAAFDHDEDYDEDEDSAGPTLGEDRVRVAPMARKACGESGNREARTNGACGTCGTGQSDRLPHRRRGSGVD